MKPASRTRRGVSLIELMVSLMIMGVLISFSIPSFARAVEQSKADVAGGNLRTVWSAQRLYRLDNSTYAATLDILVTAGLIDSNFPGTSGSSTTPYNFLVVFPSSDPTGVQTFSITATRNGGNWSGYFSIDQTGTIDPTLTLTYGSERAISPSFQ
jgi:prepilin-type N-terminal cleavage/methylation domain-containing protein